MRWYGISVNDTYRNSAAAALLMIAGGCRPERSATAAEYDSSRVSLASAESGIDAARKYLATHCRKDDLFTAVLSTPERPKPLPVSLDAENPDLHAAGGSFVVMAVNNDDDPGFTAGRDSDGKVILEATGTGPLRHTSRVRVSLIAKRCPGETTITGFEKPIFSPLP
jgi:hypothetical protein